LDRRRDTPGHRETCPLLCQETLEQFHTDKVKISFILFDEIEKASAALWNLSLGILDKAVLTLGDNRKVDFSRAMIFMTSSLGAGEMSALASPRWGFAAKEAVAGETFNAKIVRSGTEAAGREFTPEFINCLDKIVVFKSLAIDELHSGY
jgi:ATP-dependent Clp protease ATP-binding subunit ClpB